MSVALERLQAVLVDCCVADDPVAALASARAAHPELAKWLDGIDPDGLRLTAVLHKKLRFERILRGDRELQEQFATDPQRFAIAFRDYLNRVPPTCVFPQEEAARFRQQ